MRALYFRQYVESAHQLAINVTSLKQHTWRCRELFQYQITLRQLLVVQILELLAPRSKLHQCTITIYLESGRACRYQELCQRGCTISHSLSN